MQEVGGSSPPVPTMILKSLKNLTFSLFMLEFQTVNSKNRVPIMRNIRNQLIFCMSLMLFMPLSYAQDEIEELIVTANKRTESVQDIAMNVSVLTEDVLLKEVYTDPKTIFALSLEYPLLVEMSTTPSEA